MVSHIVKMYYVYILESLKDNRFYIGYTQNNPVTRLGKHNDGSVSSTKLRRPLKLIYFEAYLNQSDALGREKFLKSGSGHRFIKKQLNNYLAKNE